jgi:hypothetical protein
MRTATALTLSIYFNGCRLFRMSHELLEKSCSKAVVRKQMFENRCSKTVVREQLFENRCSKIVVRKQLFENSWSKTVVRKQLFETVVRKWLFENSCSIMVVRKQLFEIWFGHFFENFVHSFGDTFFHNKRNAYILSKMEWVTFWAFLHKLIWITLCIFSVGESIVTL